MLHKPTIQEIQGILAEYEECVRTERGKRQGHPSSVAADQRMFDVDDLLKVAQIEVINELRHDLVDFKLLFERIAEALELMVGR